MGETAETMIRLVKELEGDTDVELEEEINERLSAAKARKVGNNDEEEEEEENRAEEFQEEEVVEIEEDNECEENKPKLSQYLIFSKLHTLLHYPQLVRQYGPLVLFSTLKYERKHVIFKNLSGIMKNFRNPALTFAKFHQQSLVLVLQENNFLQTDFFASSRVDIGSLERDLKLPQQQLNSDLYPHLLNKNILRKISLKEDSRLQLWMQAENFVKTKAGEMTSIYAVGTIYQLHKSGKKQHPPELTLKYNNFFVNLKYLSHRNDFLYSRTVNREKTHFLIFGLM